MRQAEWACDGALSWQGLLQAAALHWPAWRQPGASWVSQTAMIGSDTGQSCQLCAMSVRAYKSWPFCHSALPKMRPKMIVTFRREALYCSTELSELIKACRARS